jgi:dCTP deaminase
MILSGHAIRDAVDRGDIRIEPFDARHLGPNSYDYRLQPELVIIEPGETGEPRRVTIEDAGFTLEPGRLYLGATEELIGSERYAMTLLGRSSLGRLGLYLNITADLGHIGAVSNWTLELKVVQPLVVYPRMRIGQVAFWTAMGTTAAYTGRYLGDRGPVTSRDSALSSPSNGIGPESPPPAKDPSP